MKCTEKPSAKNKFANRIVIIVIVVELIITAVVLGTYVWQRTVIPSGVITALTTFWGGELLLLSLRQIFGSDVLKQSKKESSEGSQDESI